MDAWEGMTEAEFRGFVNRRIDSLESKIDDNQEKLSAKLDNVLDLLRLGKLGAEIVRWTVGIGAALATMWGAFHFFQKP